MNTISNRKRRHNRVRAKIKGTNKRPRLCVFRSANHIYAQLIDDQKNKVLSIASDLDLKAEKSATKEKNTKGDIGRKIFLASEVGNLIAQKAKEKKIIKVVFDRGGYKYHGRVKALAEGARQGGLEF